MKKFMAVMSVIVGAGMVLFVPASYAGGMGAESGQNLMAWDYSFTKSAEKLPEYQASTIIGSEVKNEQGNYLGRITDLMIDPADGRIAFAVLSHGGVLGIPMRFVAVPFRALTPGHENKVFLLDVSKEKIAAAPSFDRDHWPDLRNRDWSRDIYRYYGQMPYWEESENCQP
jgi:sporulation protein YlmC with PRC-barrel domain